MEKLTFDPAFQEELIRFTINDEVGFKILDYISNSHFSLVQHAVIYYTIEKAYKRLGRIPSYPVLNEDLKKVFTERDFATNLSEEDRVEIKDLLNGLFQRNAKDGDILLEEAAKFGSYVELKDTLSHVDLEDFGSYNNFATRVLNAISVADLKKDDQGIFLIKDIRERQMQRQAKEIVFPTPFLQVNRLTNGGGYEKNSIIVILDRPKKLKTFGLINVARGYMRQKRKVLFIDLENGEEGLAMRLEQSTAKVTKKEILRGSRDRDVQKILRKYKRLGGEVVIKRIPAYSTTKTIQQIIDQIYREEGIRFDVLLIDYIALMGSDGSKRDEETTRIGAAYIDVANLALKNDFIHIWTAMHVVRNAYTRSETRYRENDIAKAIDIIRHVQAIYGFNRTEDEIDADIARWEVIAQRDGLPVGRAYFNINAGTQRMDELTKRQVEELEVLTGGPPEPEVQDKGDM